MEATQEQIKQHRDVETPKPVEEPRSASSRGSILVDKVNEPLDAILKAFEARLANRKIQEQR